MQYITQSHHNVTMKDGGGDFVCIVELNRDTKWSKMVGA